MTTDEENDMNDNPHEEFWSVDNVDVINRSLQTSFGDDGVVVYLIQTIMKMLNLLMPSVHTAEDEDFECGLIAAQTLIECIRHIVGNMPDVSDEECERGFVIINNLYDMLFRLKHPDVHQWENSAELAPFHLARYEIQKFLSQLGNEDQRHTN